MEIKYKAYKYLSILIKLKKMFSGFYCKKCNIIPLIRLNILDNKNFNFTVKCKCNTKFLNYDKLYNNYYSKNIEQKNIINEKIIEEIIEDK